MPRKKTDTQVLMEFNMVHKNKYDYSLMEYINGTTHIDIICPIHGVFNQQPRKHKSGQGCPKCSDSKFKDTMCVKYKSEIIDKFISAHGKEYDYSKVNYKTSKNKVEIICSKHGSFWQTPNRHLSGTRCPKCVNENNGGAYHRMSSIERKNILNAYAYFIRLSCDTGETFDKIGITRNPNQRFSSIRHYKITESKVINFDNMDMAYIFEKSMHSKLHNIKYKPSNSIGGGDNECFKVFNWSDYA